MNESKFKKGNFVRKSKGSWWEGRVVGFYDTAENPDGVAVQLDKPNGPVQIYPAAAMELMPAPADQMMATDSFDHAKAKQFFTDYFVKNYPGPDTIIFDPKWHAPRLFEVAMRCIRSATATPEKQP